LPNVDPDYNKQAEIVANAVATLGTINRLGDERTPAVTEGET
jgi:hypothetical protein